MKRIVNFPRSTTGMALLLAAFVLTAVAWSQAPQRPGASILPAPTNSTARNIARGADNDIPRAALLTEKGMQLAAKLKMLRESESRMGSRHPSLPEVQRQIAEIRTELREWVRAPSKQNGDGEPRVRELTRDELQQIVFRLAEEVDVLKQKVARLESRR